jgi:cysteine desulfurase/selenocysteine lyase
MLNKLSGEFRLSEDLIYLNHAGVSPWPARTAEAVRKFADENMVHGSRRYPQWIETETALRERARELLNAPSPDDIAFMKNTSEALSVVAYGLQWKEGDSIVSTNQEFPSNRIVWESLASKGIEFREADLGASSHPEDALFALVDGGTKLITVSSVQFSTGLRMDLEKIGDFCKSRDILFCIDAIQSLGAVNFDVRKYQPDFVMADGHKWMLGPEGLAIFYCSSEMREKLTLHQYGWHMVHDLYEFEQKEWRIAKTARCFECGSPNMLGIYALNASLSLLLEAGMDTVERELLKKTEYLFERIRSNPHLELITPDRSGRYAGIVTFRHTKKDNKHIYDFLMNNNVMCAYRNRGIRLSPHFYTPDGQLDRVFTLMKSC